MLADYYPYNFWDLRIHTPWRVLRRVPWRAIWDGTQRLDCGVCGWRGPSVARGANRRDRWCPRCKGRNRHRLIAWYLTEKRPELLAPGKHFLHVAPERSLGGCFERIPGLIYESCDVMRDDVTHRIDLQREIVAEDVFDVILINHVMEHIQDDRAALRNLYRMLRPGGICVITVPIRPNGQPTDEDPSVTDPQERVRRFGQFDHVRYYGADLIDRIQEAGFAAEILRSEDADAAAVERYSMGGEMLFLARRPAADLAQQGSGAVP